MSTGLSGGHRTGKTTLAKAYAERENIPFAQTSVSAIFKELGHDPSEVFDFRTRLTIQEQILIRMNRLYAEFAGQPFITDRTPLDFLGYTLSEAVGDAVLPEDQARLARYVDSCFVVTNRWFSEILVVQPGIELVAEPGKAVLNAAYIEHLNSLIIGLCSDERLKVLHFYIPRHRLSLESRMKSIDFARQRGIDTAVVQAQEMPSNLFH